MIGAILRSSLSLKALQHPHFPPPKQSFSTSLDDDSDYHKVADQTMDQLVDLFDDLGERIELQDYDVLYSVRLNIGF